MSAEGNVFVDRMSPIDKRRFAALVYLEPEELLRSIMPNVIGILQKQESVADLPAQKKKEFLEKHQAGFFAFMMKHVGGEHARITVCVNETDDFDCILKGETERGTVYKPVQLKQLPSHQENEDIDLQRVIDQLKIKYPTSTSLVVVIWINRDIKLDFKDLTFEGLAIEQLWLLGDSGTGVITLDGGPVISLIDGIRRSATMTNGTPSVRPIRFRDQLPNH